MVVPQACSVHGQGPIVSGHPLFPQSWGISCAQTAIIPTNSEIDASAAASSTNIFNMPSLLGWNIRRTLFLFCSRSQGMIIYLTPQRHDIVKGGESADSSGEAGAPELLTDEMIEAGALALA